MPNDVAVIITPVSEPELGSVADEDLTGNLELVRSQADELGVRVVFRGAHGDSVELRTTGRGALELFLLAAQRLYVGRDPLVTAGGGTLRLEQQGERVDLWRDGDKKRLELPLRALLAEYLAAIALFYDVRLAALGPAPRAQELLAATTWGVLPSLVETSEQWLAQRAWPRALTGALAPDTFAHDGFRQNLRQALGGASPIEDADGLEESALAVWRGPAPDFTLPAPQRDMAWLIESKSDDFFVASDGERLFSSYKRASTLSRFVDFIGQTDPAHAFSQAALANRFDSFWAMADGLFDRGVAFSFGDISAL